MCPTNKSRFFINFGNSANLFTDVVQKSVKNNLKRSIFLLPTAAIHSPGTREDQITGVISQEGTYSSCVFGFE